MKKEDRHIGNLGEAQEVMFVIHKGYYDVTNLSVNTPKVMNFIEYLEGSNFVIPSMSQTAKEINKIAGAIVIKSKSQDYLTEERPVEDFRMLDDEMNKVYRKFLETAPVPERKPPNLSV